MLLVSASGYCCVGPPSLVYCWCMLSSIAWKLYHYVRRGQRRGALCCSLASLFVFIVIVVSSLCHHCHWCKAEMMVLSLRPSIRCYPASGLSHAGDARERGLGGKVVSVGEVVIGCAGVVVNFVGWGSWLICLRQLSFATLTAM